MRTGMKNFTIKNGIRVGAYAAAAALTFSVIYGAARGGLNAIDKAISRHMEKKHGEEVQND